MRFIYKGNYFANKEYIIYKNSKKQYRHIIIFIKKRDFDI